MTSFVPPAWRCPVNGGGSTDACRLTTDHIGLHLARRCRRCGECAVANVGGSPTPHCLRCGATYDDRLERRPGVCGGRTVFRGSRLELSIIAGRVRAGERWSEIAEDYPYLIPDDVELARAYRLRSPGDTGENPAIA